MILSSSTRSNRASIGACASETSESTKTRRSMSTRLRTGRDSLKLSRYLVDGKTSSISIETATDASNRSCPAISNSPQNALRNRIGRRSTRCRLLKVQKAVNFYEWSNKEVQVSDNYFFEQVVGWAPVNYRIIASSTSSSHHLAANFGLNELTSGKMSPSSRKSSRVTVDYSSCESEASAQLTAAAEQHALSRLTICDDPRVLHNLYVEALYTIVHKVGKSTFPVPEAQLISYVQNAFQIEDQTHAVLMDCARKEKPPLVLLNVHLLEARDLIAKDINGFSDPYAMLGVIPGKQNTNTRSRGNSNFIENGGINTNSVLGSNTAASIIAAGTVNLDTDEGVGSSDKISPPVSPSSGTKERSSGSGNMLQRFSGSFCRKLQASNLGVSQYGSRKGVKSESKAIPAKLIKASSVQYKTLNPKWNEKFQFTVDDVFSDKFHLDIWDYDDNEQSILDAVTSLNQISGFKGLGRYFKEVTQSARADSNELTDDFLGSVTLRLKDIPSSGLEDWFVLKKRSDKSKVSGAVLLRCWLSTKEERVPRAVVPTGDDVLQNSIEQEDLTDVRQHIELIRQFALEEIRSSGLFVGSFQGMLPKPAVTILHQHAIQGDLTDIDQAMCKWLAYSVMVKVGVSFSFLYDVLTDLISKWRLLALDKESENMLAESFETFNEHCRKLILEHRTFAVNADNTLQTPTLGNTKPVLGSGNFPEAINSTVMKQSNIESFTNMIRCLKLMRESPIYCKCVPFHKQFDKDITDLLMDSANAYFSALKDKCEVNLTACEELHFLVSGLNRACEKILIFDPIFKSYAEVDYGQPTYLQFDSLLSDYISSEMMSERQVDLKNMLLNVPVDELTLIIVLKIHCVMNEFVSFQKPKMKYKLQEIDWAATFDRIITKWVDLARLKAFARVDLACQLDVQIQISTSNEIRHTSSYVDICHIVKQLFWIWEHIQVNDVSLHVDLTKKLVQIICKLTEYYVDRITEQLAIDGFSGTLQSCLPPSLINIFCATINNSEQVRRVLALNEKLRLDEISELYEKQFKKETYWRSTIEKELVDCENYIGKKIEQIIERLVRRQTPYLKKHVFHLAWSPAACPVEQSLKPLTDMLDSELSLVHRTLLHKNFVRVMHSQVNLLLELLQECIGENSGLEPNFYQRLCDAWIILMDFFHAEGKGISMELFDTIPAYNSFMSTISLNQLSTIKLIELYYKDLLKEQNEVNECKYGILNLRAYYNNNSQTLVIDVIGAKQIIPLDSNGLSDPFVVIELVPRLHYPNKPATRTKVVSKCLNPIFDESFEFQIPSKLAPGAMIHFVVMDHDFLCSNDFAGEALLDLADVPGFAQAGAPNTLRQFNLILIHPIRTKESVKVLASRKDDKDAQEFVRTLNISY